MTTDWMNEYSALLLGSVEHLWVVNAYETLFHQRSGAQLLSVVNMIHVIITLPSAAE